MSDLPEDKTPEPVEEPVLSTDMDADALDALFSSALMSADMGTIKGQAVPEVEAAEPTPTAVPEELPTPEPMLSEEAVGDSAAVDAPLVADLDEALLLTQDNVDAFLSDLDVDTPIETVAETPLPPVVTEPVITRRTPTAEPEAVSDDLLAALLNAAETASTKTDVGMENLVAAATAPTAAVNITPLPQEPVGAIPGAAAAAHATEQQPAPGAYPDAVPSPLKRPGIWITLGENVWLQAYGTRVAASLFAGLLGAVATYGLLAVNQETRPTIADLGVQQMIDLEAAMERARALAAEGKFQEVTEVLARPAAAAQSSELSTEAEFLLLEAKSHTLDAPIGSDAYSELQNDLQQWAKAHPDSPMAAKALRIEADIYLKQELPSAAYASLRSIAERFPDDPNADAALLETARLGIELNRVTDAADYLQQLLANYPGSKLGGEARLLLGDTYLRAGMEDDAKQMFERVAKNDPDPQASAEGTLRLGRMAIQSGDLAGAKQRLGDYLAKTVSLEGTDEVQLQLAQVERAQGNMDDAQSQLRDLINFFPASPTTPKAYVELTEVTDALGERDEALSISQEAAIKYPKDPAVLRSKGMMLGLTGRAKSAAETLLAANEAGAYDPEMLLTAARHLRTSGMYPEALRAYTQLQTEYSGLPAAIEGGIEMARLHNTRGEVREAVEALKALEVAAATSPQHVDVLAAQVELYRELGWQEDLASTAEMLATSATEDEDRATAALGLIGAGNTEAARTLFQDINVDQLRAPTAYGLTWELGEHLLAEAPREGLSLMEQAYVAHPDLRTREQEKTLLRAYLSANRPAAARRVVMEMAADAQGNATDSAHLIEASIAWGDYLYGRGDFRTAADAYAMAEEEAAKLTTPPSEPGRDPRWAQYQRANALLQLRDFQAGLRMLDEIAASTAPWAREAETKATFTRMEQQLGDLPRAAG